MFTQVKDSQRVMLPIDGSKPPVPTLKVIFSVLIECGFRFDASATVNTPQVPYQKTAVYRHHKGYPNLRVSAVMKEPSTYHELVWLGDWKSTPSLLIPPQILLKGASYEDIPKYQERVGDSILGYLRTSWERNNPS